MVLHHHVLALDMAGFVEALAERSDIARGGISRPTTDKPDDRHRRLLRARRERPCGGRATEQRDEITSPHHSITSSASASSVGGISTPNAFAVARLMTSSNLAPTSTGRSPGFSPLRIRPT